MATGLLDMIKGLEYNPTPFSQGLMNLGAAMLQASGPSLQPVGFGSALGQGLQAFTQGAQGQKEAQLLELQRQMQLAALNPEVQRQQMLDKARFQAEAEQLYPKAPSIPTGFERAEGGGIRPMQIQGANGQPTDYMTHQINMARQRAQIPGYGEEARLGMAIEDQLMQREAALRAERNQEVTQNLAREKLDLLKQKAEKGQRLPVSQIDKITSDQANLENSQRLMNTFQPDYGGHFISGQFDMRNRIGRTFGDNSGEVQWWQDHQQHKNKIRNDLFGSALTPGEQAEWEKASINPTMDPEQIQQNLKRQAEIEKQGYQRRLQNIKKGGYDVSGFEQPAPEQAGPVKPQGVSDEKWNSYLNYLRSKGALK